MSVGGDVPAQAVADVGRVRQVLINLVSNAVKFSAPGTVTLRVETAPAPGGRSSGGKRGDCHGRRQTCMFMMSV